MHPVATRQTKNIKLRISFNRAVCRSSENICSLQATHSQIVVAKGPKGARIVQAGRTLEVSTLVPGCRDVIKHYRGPWERELCAIAGCSTVELSLCIVINGI